MLSKLSHHLSTHNLITDKQWGFRAGRSTESVLLNMTERWSKALDNRLRIYRLQESI